METEGRIEAAPAEPPAREDWSAFLAARAAAGRAPEGAVIAAFAAAAQRALAAM